MKEFVLSQKTPFLYILRMFLAEACVVILLILVNVSFLKEIIYLSLFLLVLLSVYAVFYFKSVKVLVLRDTIVIKKGILIRREHVLPFKKQVYTLSVQTPLAKLLRLKAISFKAVRKTVFLPELDVGEAQRLLKVILQGDENEI